MISSTGALGFYHEEFATASREHSVAYLDGVFVDMMWYKAFSVWLLLHLHRNVLFQDIDIIWLKNPFPFFHQSIQAFKTRARSAPSSFSSHPDAYLSDDGQRASPRFSPFYANSGFYYFLSNEKTIQVAWSIMMAFDVMQSGGSHQNVFTQRILEGYDMFSFFTQSLSQREFTNGAMYHHQPTFIKKIQSRQVVPYMFHMCWTANKQQKLDYFHTAHMWYLQPELTYKDFIPEGGLSEEVRRKSFERRENIWELIWNEISEKVCYTMPESP